MKGRLLPYSVILLLVLLHATASAATDPKALVGQIASTKQSIEDNVRSEKWAEAEAGIATVEKEMAELVAAVKPANPENVTKQIGMIVEGMRKAVANKSDEDYETPAEALRHKFMDLIDLSGFGKPAVFVVMKMQVDEALETNARSDFDGLAEEMEEIVDMRDEARKEAKKSGVDSAKIEAILDLAWDISVDAKEKNQASSQKRLERMKSIIDSV